MVRRAQDCRAHARWVEEEIPSRLGRDHESQLGKHREERKQERFKVGNFRWPFHSPSWVACQESTALTLPGWALCPPWSGNSPQVVLVGILWGNGLGMATTWPAFWDIPQPLSFFLVDWQRVLAAARAPFPLPHALEQSVGQVIPVQLQEATKSQITLFPGAKW